MRNDGGATVREIRATTIHGRKPPPLSSSLSFFLPLNHLNVTIVLHPDDLYFLSTAIQRLSLLLNLFCEHFRSTRILIKH